MSTYFFKIVAGMEPFIDDFWALRFTNSLLKSSKETGEILKLQRLILGNNSRIFVILRCLLKFEIIKFMSERLVFLHGFRSN